MTAFVPFVQNCLDGRVYTCVKWYEDFSDVSFIENLLAELDWKDFLFIRIGEDYDDTEVRGDFWDNPFELGLTRKISMEVQLPSPILKKN